MTGCEWFALCANAAVGTIWHPILGEVPTCQRCADRTDYHVERYPSAEELQEFARGRIRAMPEGGSDA